MKNGSLCFKATLEFCCTSKSHSDPLGDGSKFRSSWSWMFEGLVSCKSMSWCWFRYLTQATTTGVTTYPKDFDAEKKLISKFQIPTCVKYTKDWRLEAKFPALDILEWKSHTPWDTWNLIAKMGDSRYQLLQDSFHQHEHYQWQLRTKNYPSAQYWFHHVLETREDLSEAVTFTVTSSVEVDSHSMVTPGRSRLH